MKYLRLISCLILLVVLTNCNSETPIASDSATELVPKKHAAEQAATHSTSTVYTFEGMNEVGSSKLVRTKDGVSYTLETTGLEPGHVVTLWMIIFNNPEHCSNSCGEDDLANLDATVDVVYSSGRVIGGTGTANYAGHRSEGDNSGSIFPAWLGLPSPGLIDAQAAEIHLLVHTHGPKIPGLTNEMLHSFNAGCGPIFNPALPPVPEELGTHGPNTCLDTQFAVHMPQ